MTGNLDIATIAESSQEILSEIGNTSAVTQTPSEPEYHDTITVGSKRFGWQPSKKGKVDELDKIYRIWDNSPYYWYKDDDKNVWKIERSDLKTRVPFVLDLDPERDWKGDTYMNFGP
jgi:hypothetical protein